MLTLKKRTNKTIILECILGLSCIVSLAGCSPKKDEVENNTVTTTEQTTTNQSNVDYASFAGIKIEVNTDTSIYAFDGSQYLEKGNVSQGTYLDIDQDASGQYLHIKDSNFYIDGAYVQTCDRWFANRNHLLASNMSLKTKDAYTIYDVNNVAILNVSESDEYVVYVNEADDDPRFGISFQGGIYYINASDVESTSGSFDTQEVTAQSIPVMMYHFFYDANNGESRVDGNYVEVSEFDEQLTRLQEENYQSLTMREVEYFMYKRAFVPQNVFAITIDDGDPSVYKYAYPIITKHEMNATLFLICGWEDPTLSYDFIEMRESGLELQSHGFLMHQGGCSGMGHGGRLMCVGHDEGVQDTIQSFDYVDGGFVYCYPFGDINENGESIVRDAGAKLAFTTAFGRISPNDDPLALSRIRVTGGNGIEAYMRNVKGS